MARSASLPTALDALYFCAPVRLLRRSWSEFGRLLLPADCAGCSAPDENLCPDCRARLHRAAARPYRAEAGAGSLPFLDDRHCVPAGEDPADRQILPVVAAGRYRYELARVLLAFKNHGRTDLAPVLATVLARAVHEAAAQLDTGAGSWLLVPVPSRPGSRRRRGYEPLDLLLRRLQRRRLLPPGVTVVRAAVVGSRPGARLRGLLPGPSQKALGRSARRRNAAGSMRVRRRCRQVLAGRCCLLVDDVLTTGATLAELARALGQAGARVFGGAVLAAASAPSGDPGYQPEPGPGP